MKLSRLLTAGIMAVCSLLVSQSYAAKEIQQPKANPEATVTAGNARFTVLTPRMIRMEYSPNGQFEDNKTLTIVNRQLPVPKFAVKQSAKKTEIKTDALTLTYRPDGEPFNAKNLSVKFKMGKQTVDWHPGKEDTGNLMGTTRTLDGADGITFKNGGLEPGLLSRDGWTVIDDSRNHLLIPEDTKWEEWVSVRPDSTVTDLYLFAYGHDYKQALADYQKVAGRAPLPPKYTFGYWWSRYWQYSDNELFDLVDKIRSFDMPLDVLIVDMDWHETYGLKSKNSEKDEYGQRIGWTGYTWQKELFPNHKNFLRWTDREGLQTALNLHPASGIQPYEAVYKDFVKAYGWADTTKSVPYHLDDRRWAEAYFDTVLTPMEREGVDFWWPDWQQWKLSKFTPGLSNTFWLNLTFFKHAQQEHPGIRPFIYHRWGGLGSHRYPLGFSGDTYIEWSSLAYLPKFTATASNVNYGYWGHDIGGHMYKHKGSQYRTDPERYLRWLQYGVFTPIFKTHSTKDMRIVRYPWSFPDHQFMMRDAIKLRYSLVPYIYNAARQNYETGVAMTRPMYYEYPENPRAYETDQQFFFGDDIIGTVIATPVDSVTGLAERPMWIPEGRWYDMATGDMLEGERDTVLQYTMAENPWLARAGAILPMNPDGLKTLQQRCDTLVLTFIPGADGELIHYEDDGISADYDSVYATTNITKRLTANGIDVRISPREGTYAGASDSRAYELRFPATMPPARVTVNGREYPYSRFPKAGEWTYDPYSLQPVVYTAMMPTDTAVDVQLTFGPEGNQPEKLYGKRKYFNRAIDLTTQYKIEQGNHGENMKMLPVQYLKVSQAPNFIRENPEAILQYLNDFDNNKTEFFEMIDEIKLASPEFKTRLKEQLK